MAVSSTTKMMNLLTLVLVTLPGLTLSFTNRVSSKDPLKDLYEELQLGVPPPAKEPDYVCCNQPGTRPPRPRLPHFRSLTLSFEKRDDTDALLREALKAASRRLSEANGRRGYYQSAETPLRDSLLSEILRLDRRGGGSGLTTYDGSAMAGKRGRGAYVNAGKRGQFGPPGGPNVKWPGAYVNAGKRGQFGLPAGPNEKWPGAYVNAGKRGQNGVPGGPNEKWTPPAQQQVSRRFANR